MKYAQYIRKIHKLIMKKTKKRDDLFLLIDRMINPSHFYSKNEKNVNKSKLATSIKFIKSDKFKSRSNKVS